jgi:hypothetical protein
MPHGIFLPLRFELGWITSIFLVISEDLIFSSKVRKELFSSMNGFIMFGHSSLYGVASGIHDMAVLSLTDRQLPPGVPVLLSL